MKIVSSGSYVFACTVIAILAGCGGKTTTSTLPAVPSSDADYNAYSHQKTFRYTGHRQSFIVPKGVEQLQILARGGMGGGPASVGGGLVGRVLALISVTPGEQLFVFVGGAGSGQSGGFNGGANGGSSTHCECYGYGGGGASDVRSNGYEVGDRILVAGGGGGNGANGDDSTDFGGSGGGGGGFHALSGKDGTGDYPGYGGVGGSQNNGGSGGPGGSGPSGTGESGSGGSLGAGGDGGGGGSATSGAGGGGGGGGYYGGGGGGAGSGSPSRSDKYEAGGGGGGGSSYLEQSAIKGRFWRKWKSKAPDGLVVFSWGNKPL
jgi:hypothetical protein